MVTVTHPVDSRISVFSVPSVVINLSEQSSDRPPAFQLQTLATAIGEGRVVGDQHQGGALVAVDAE